ncbi:MAG: phosphatase PAP2 family protein [Bacteroidales bacterium]|nr:MAG: phosphatase PAP2 family protein [Bacteroidales bacterium]
MIETLNTWDINLFLFLNGMHSPFWDRIMWVITGKLTWLPLYLFMLAWLIRDFRWKVLVLVLFIAALITMSDQSSVHLFKEVFQRLRPCHNPQISEMVHIVRGKCGGQYGFISSHAANTFAIAFFSLLLIKNRYFTFFIVLWASVVSYSRVYLGVHYPGDILCGALLGLILGILVYRGYRIFEIRVLNKRSFFTGPAR